MKKLFHQIKRGLFTCNVLSNSIVGICVVALFGVGLVTYLTRVAYAREPNKPKMVEVTDVFNAPIEILSIRTAELEIIPNTEFFASQRWMEGMAITLRNKSLSTVNHVAVSIRFPRVSKENGQLDLVDTLSYGESPLSKSDCNAYTKKGNPIIPGSQFELSLPESRYQGIMDSLSEEGYPAEISVVRIYVNTVGFEDGRIWMAGKFYVLDPVVPGKLIPTGDRTVPDKIRSQSLGPVLDKSTSNVEEEPQCGDDINETHRIRCNPITNDGCDVIDIELVDNARGVFRYRQHIYHSVMPID